ncbi:phosphotransferase, partial [Glycomyces sp. NRRL B-16210]|uniref:phosphotransferase n=1 Tax=Glycomyces sp. NRRL B-16210 TaxID=1463821 RepID=UPI0004BE4902
MELIGAGRESKVYALDERTVLRRSGFDVGGEACVMRHARELGIDVPRVVDVSGGDLVMERLHGPTLAAELIAGRRTPAEASAVMLGLLDRLHRLDAPDWLPSSPRGLDLDGLPGPARLLHLDLHPENVILTDRGPVLIDWANAAAGPAEFDTAVTWAIMAGVDLAAAGLPPEAAAAFRGALLPPLRAAVSEPALALAAAYREADPNVGPDEVRALADALAA